MTVRWCVPARERKKRHKIWTNPDSSACFISPVVKKRSRLSHREQEPQDAVFAYLKETALRIKEFHEPSDVAIEFQVPVEDVTVGDLHAEGGPQYKATLKPLKDYLYWVTERYYEEECLVFHPVRNIIGYYDARTFKPLTEAELLKRCGFEKATVKPIEWWKH